MANKRERELLNGGLMYGFHSRHFFLNRCSFDPIRISWKKYYFGVCGKCYCVPDTVSFTFPTILVASFRLIGVILPPTMIVEQYAFPF